jgi:hypothetical protein
MLGRWGEKKHNGMQGNEEGKIQGKTDNIMNNVCKY